MLCPGASPTGLNASAMAHILTQIVESYAAKSVRAAAAAAAAAAAMVVVVVERAAAVK